MEPEAVEIVCEDGMRLGGHWWPRRLGDEQGVVVVNCATGVQARFYHAYARFLAEHGYHVLTYDYRGIGLSRPERLRGSGYRWRDWGRRISRPFSPMSVRRRGICRFWWSGIPSAAFCPAMPIMPARSAVCSLSARNMPIGRIIAPGGAVRYFSNGMSSCRC
ncbi:hypothetical protein [Rhizobium sp. G21]|uniref:hypothetical protein n=1 Tax=Rhizobium sp. G21 TaxID=2758439 RepID=UPI0028B13F7C|nr:hypothetical protein [Rhizobium sp. G21]